MLLFCSVKYFVIAKFDV